MKPFFVMLLVVLIIACHGKKVEPKNAQYDTTNKETFEEAAFDTTIKTIHVFVALCDNKYQGIVPVPASIGNGQDPNSNLYWGCGYGVRSFFKNSAEWILVKHYPVSKTILERLIFKNKQHNAYLVADAYDGQYIQQCTIDFLKSCAGQKKDTLLIQNKVTGVGSNAKLIAYVGHNGLMDFQLTDTIKNKDGIERKAMILACASRNYFWKHLQLAKAKPLLWTTNLMCPEAYTLHDAISGFLNSESDENIRVAAATAYSKYQKCSLKAAKGLLVTGW